MACGSSCAAPTVSLGSPCVGSIEKRLAMQPAARPTRSNPTGKRKVAPAARQGGSKKSRAPVRCSDGDELNKESDVVVEESANAETEESPETVKDGEEYVASIRTTQSFCDSTVD